MPFIHLAEYTYISMPYEKTLLVVLLYKCQMQRILNVCGDQNSRKNEKTCLHRQRIIVWYAVWSGGVNGRYFFKNSADEAVVINGTRYDN